MSIIPCIHSPHFCRHLLQDSENPNFDGFVKSPSAALHFNFFVAAHLVSALHSSVFVRLASGAFYETIVPVTFYEIMNFYPSGKRGI
jgi:hypothetical protein